MSPARQTKASELHGEALLLARDEVPQELLDRLAVAAAGKDPLWTETAGNLAGVLFANPASHQGTSSSQQDCFCSPVRSTATRC